MDKILGEVLEESDGRPKSSSCVVVDPVRLAEMDNLLVEYEDTSGFRPEVKSRPLFEDAVFVAAGAFMEKVRKPLRLGVDNALVQVYPEERLVAVIFEVRHGGEELYTVRWYPIPQAVVDSLVAGKIRWKH